MRRQLKFFDILCLGVNGIVGSGIFLLPGRFLGGLGPASILLFLLCGVMLISVCLCYSEAASRIDRNGGTYSYARVAFGNNAGFVVGWVSAVCDVVNYATVAVGLMGYAGTMVPWLAEGVHAKLALGVMIAFLTILNIRGVKLGAGTLNVLTVAKMVPLLIFVAIGVFAIHPAHFVPFAPHGFSPAAGLLLAACFTYQGFEFAPVPSGEVADAKRVVPRAMLWSLMISMVLYAIIQTIIVGSGAQIAASEAPLADAAGWFMGPWGAVMISVGGIISMSGYVAGSALICPRSVAVLCEDGHLPRMGARLHARYDTPAVAILFVAITVYVMTLFLNFDRLVDISAFAVVIRYLFTCISVPILRRKIPDAPQTFRIPGGWLVPIVGVAVSILFMAQIKVPELMWLLWIVLAGLAVSFAYRRWQASRFQ